MNRIYGKIGEEGTVVLTGDFRGQRDPLSIDEELLHAFGCSHCVTGGKRLFMPNAEKWDLNEGLYQILQAAPNLGRAALETSLAMLAYVVSKKREETLWYLQRLLRKGISPRTHQILLDRFWSLVTTKPEGDYIITHRKDGRGTRINPPKEFLLLAESVGAIEWYSCPLSPRKPRKRLRKILRMGKPQIAVLDLAALRRYAVTGGAPIDCDHDSLYKAWPELARAVDKTMRMSRLRIVSGQTLGSWTYGKPMLSHRMAGYFDSVPLAKRLQKSLFRLGISVEVDGNATAGISLLKSTLAVMKEKGSGHMNTENIFKMAFLGFSPKDICRAIEVRQLFIPHFDMKDLSGEDHEIFIQLVRKAYANWADSSIRQLMLIDGENTVQWWRSCKRRNVPASEGRFLREMVQELGPVLDCPPRHPLAMPEVKGVLCSNEEWRFHALAGLLSDCCQCHGGVGEKAYLYAAKKATANTLWFCKDPENLVVGKEDEEEAWAEPNSCTQAFLWLSQDLGYAVLDNIESAESLMESNKWLISQLKDMAEWYATRGVRLLVGTEYAQYQFGTKQSCPTPILPQYSDAYGVYDLTAYFGLSVDTVA